MSSNDSTSSKEKDHIINKGIMMDDTSKEDKKKWYIDRIEKGIESNLTELESGRRDFMSQATTYDMFLTTWKNAILTGVSIGASIILGLSSLVHLRDILLQILAIDLSIGLVSFMIFTIVKDKVYVKNANIDLSFATASDGLVYLKTFLISKTFYLDKINIETLEFIFRYYVFAISAVRE